MKVFLSLVVNLCILAANVHSQIQEQLSLNEFLSGETGKFSSNGEGKSQGLRIHFKYPASWKSIEGERPHVVRKFAQVDDHVLAIIIVNKQEVPFKQSEIDEVMTSSGLKSLVPSTGRFIASNCGLKIEGIKVGMVEYSISDSRMDRMFYSHLQQYSIFFENFLLSIQFMVTNSVGENSDSVDKRFGICRPLFSQMFNSLVIDNVWEK